ncbi:MAG: hypothetical protein H6735_06455 [Alphaproteobacteria bacterium]|nr:hypothetical protein [Alphaproteobacteria bacterium]
MAATQENAVASPGYPHHALQARATGSGLQFALLTQAERASFEAGLHTRLWKRVFEAVKAPTAGEYRRLRNEGLLPYHHLLEVLRVEAEHAAEPVTDEDVLGALDQVERDLGESWRHKMEHAINVSQAALKIMARAEERSDGVPLEPDQGVLLLTGWVGSWIVLNWTTDCVVAATDRRVVAQSEVIEAVFQDLREAANAVYTIACEAHDARFGDPDE